MQDFKVVIFIMAILITLTALANKRKLPYPVLLVVAGLIIGFIPQLPDLGLNPEVVFLIILPPLLYDAASRTSWPEFKASIRPISALAITLVFFTTVTVAIAAHYLIPGFSWPLAFILGAVVSPPDAVAASGIIKGLGLNKKVITILEGESLLNDASALIAYRYAVAAITTGSFVFWKAGLQFLLVAGGGIAIGVVAGFVFSLAHKKIENNAVVETSLTLLLPFVAYLGAEEFHVSGVLAVVCAGLIISRRSHEIFSYRARMRTRVVWDTLIFLLEGFVFILIGLQLPLILRDLNQYSISKLIGYGLLISLATILVRIIWVFAGAYWLNIFNSRKKTTEPSVTAAPDDTWKNVMVVAWTGTRGIISLAAALALPILIQDGTAFPKRHTIIFLAFVVIFVTLVVQGLTLPLLIKWLKIKAQDNTEAETKELQLYIVSSTLQYLEEEMAHTLSRNLVDQLKNQYEKKLAELTREVRRHRKAIRNNKEIAPTPPDMMLDAELQINQFQREVLLKLHKSEEFSEAALRHMEMELDINDLKLNFQAPEEE